MLTFTPTCVLFLPSLSLFLKQIALPLSLFLYVSPSLSFLSSLNSDKWVRNWCVAWACGGVEVSVRRCVVALEIGILDLWLFWHWRFGFIKINVVWWVSGLWVARFQGLFGGDGGGGGSSCWWWVIGVSEGRGGWRLCLLILVGGGAVDCGCKSWVTVSVLLRFGGGSDLVVAKIL